MNGVSIILFAAALAFALSRLSRVPGIPLLLMAGIGLQALAQWRGIKLPEDILNDMIQIGLAFLVFVAGVDLSPSRVKRRGRDVAILGTTQFLVLGLGGFGAALALQYDLITALYLGCALSASSTLVVVNQLQNRHQMFEPYGRLVLGVLLLQDLLVIVLMVVLLKTPEGFMELLTGLGGMLILGGTAWFIQRWATPRLCNRFKFDDEEMLIGALALLFFFSGLAFLLQLPILVGAFFAGFALSAFPIFGLVRAMLGSLSSFFLSLFFISIGMILVFPGIIMLIHGLVFIVVLVIVTVVLVTIIGEYLGYSTRVSIESGLLLSQTSEFSLVIALAGVAAGIISSEFFSLIALVTVSTMTLTPLIAREQVAWTLMKLHPRYRRGEPPAAELKDHVVILGLGRSGTRILKILQEHQFPAVVVDDDAAVIRRLIDQTIPCFQGDGSDRHVLERVHARQARLVVCSMRRIRDAQVALDFLKDSPAKVIVRTFEAEETAMVENAGGIAVPTADIAAERLLDWLSANNPQDK